MTGALEHGLILGDGVALVFLPRVGSPAWRQRAANDGRRPDRHVLNVRGVDQSEDRLAHAQEVAGSSPAPAPLSSDPPRASEPGCGPLRPQSSPAAAGGFVSGAAA